MRGCLRDTHPISTGSAAPGEGREGHKVVWLLVEGIQPARRMVKGHSDLACQEWFLQKLIADRLGVNIGPERVAHPCIPLSRFLALKTGHHAAGERRDKIPLQETMDESGMEQTTASVAGDTDSHR